MPPINFTDASYLKTGSAMQQRIYEIVMKSKVLEKLKAYDHVLVGTFPLDIQTSTSDIDIICQCKDVDSFAVMINNIFANKENFSLKIVTDFGLPAVVANFVIDGIPFEIFAQDLPITQQNGYLHMLAEYNILSFFGEDFKRKVIALKASGVKRNRLFASY